MQFIRFICYCCCRRWSWCRCTAYTARCNTSCPTRSPPSTSIFCRHENRIFIYVYLLWFRLHAVYFRVYSLWDPKQFLGNKISIMRIDPCLWINKNVCSFSDMPNKIIITAPTSTPSARPLKSNDWICSRCASAHVCVCVCAILLRERHLIKTKSQDQPKQQQQRQSKKHQRRK